MYHLENEILKSKIKQRIRSFFEDEGFVEVDTPLLSPTTIPEHSIKLFSTKLEGEFTQSEELFLLPSPELYMKKLLAEFHKSIFQISKAFRNSEQSSPVHSNEFTMLEYYQINATYLDTIDLTKRLIRSIFKDAKDEHITDNAVIISVDELLRKFTSFTLEQIHKRDVQNNISSTHQLNLPEGENFDDTFNRIFVHIIEPELAKYPSPVFVTDYPIEIECLAKVKNKYERERFELYYRGVELANGYSEMCDIANIEMLFNSEFAKVDGKQKVDEELSKIQLPKSSGVAIGVDRLIMLSEKIEDISDLIFGHKAH